MTANDSSSSAINRADQLASIPPLPRAWLVGQHADLLAPVRFLVGGELPPTPPPPVDRRELARALLVANRAYGHPAADELAARLADPATRVIVTGQQPGALGGPLLTLTKMAAATLWAEAASAAGEPAVAVFWVATEDHDWTEVGQLGILDGDAVEQLDLGADPQPLAPLGVRTLGGGIDAMLQRFGAIGGDRQAAWAAQLARWYRPDARFGEAFSRLAVRLLGQRTPLLLDAMLPAVKALSKPTMERLVKRRRAVEDHLEQANRRLEEAGFSLQVRPQPNLSPLFLLAGGERRRIAWEGDDDYSLRGVDGKGGSVAELQSILADNPAIISAGVLARPIVQDALLGTSLTLLGGGELSYFAQLAPLYDVLDVAPPWVTLRPQALVIDRRQQRWREELGVSLAELLGPADALQRRVAGGDAPRAVERARQRAEELLAELGPLTLALDANLERPLHKTEDQVLGALDRYAEKVGAAALARDEVTSRRVRSLRAALLPLDRPQERVLSTAHFLGRYGDTFPQALLDQLDRTPGTLSIVDPQGDGE